MDMKKKTLKIIGGIIITLALSGVAAYIISKKKKNEKTK
jgi:uncharacterized protein YpmB